MRYSPLPWGEGGGGGLDESEDLASNSPTAGVREVPEVRAHLNEELVLDTSSVLYWVVAGDPRATTPSYCATFCNLLLVCNLEAVALRTRATGGNPVEPGPGPTRQRA